MSSWAGAFVGLPFGEGPGQVTCWSLVVAVYARVGGVVLPTYGEISSADLIRVARAMRDGAVSDRWRAVAVPEALDVVLMGGPQGQAGVCHVGVMVDGARMLHAEEASGVVLVALSHPMVAGRIRGFRRYAA